jgi:triphosphoribosyl-dephospho-CoA synthase
MNHQTTLPTHATTRRCAARQIRNLAVSALWEEVVTYPKPGLVSLVDSGSHGDMTAATFLRSVLSLRHYFERMAAAGMVRSTFDALRQLGVVAEERMLLATSGINTHRGAIFNLGLLAAAAGRQIAEAAEGAEPFVTSLGEVVREAWGPAMALHRRDPRSHGSRVDFRHGAGGALAQARAGYPVIFGMALPEYRRVLTAGGSANQARVQAFFVLLGTVDDTNLLHRGGAEGLAFAREASTRFLDAGGVFNQQWRECAIDIHRQFCRRGLSPGGSADLLAACVFVHSLASDR